MLIDLHCHTTGYSACSSLTPEMLLPAARDRGLDAICLTEHDRLWPAEEIRRLSDRFGIQVLRGAEVTTEVGHVLVFGVDDLPAGMFHARSLCHAVRAAGGLTVLAHPARAGQPLPTREAISELFDAVEISNGSDGHAQNEAAAALASLTPLPGIAGSDCHSLAEVGTVATRLPCAVRNEGELVEVLRLGRHTVERLGNEGTGAKPRPERVEERPRPPKFRGYRGRSPRPEGVGEPSGLTQHRGTGAEPRPEGVGEPSGFPNSRGDEDACDG